jgi:hypothetical protein
VASLASFAFAGVGVVSDWKPPPFLGGATTVGPSISISRATDEGAHRPHGSEVIVHQWRAGNDELTLTLVRTGDGFLLRFPRLMDFELSDDGASIRARLGQTASTDTFWHLLLDQVLPRALSHRRRHVLHAAGVALDGAAVAFVGDTGAGKSTLAGEFARTGNQLLSDDALVIDPVDGEHQVVATYPSLRLRSDSLEELDLDEPGLPRVAHYSDKRRVRVSPPPAEGRPDGWLLAGIYHLDPETRVARTTITRLAARDAVTVLLRESFQLDVSDMSAAAWLLDRCANLADQVPVFRLCYPRDFRLDGVRRTLIDHVAGLVD